MNISNLVKETFDNEGHVWISSDLHLMKTYDGWKLTDDEKINKLLNWNIDKEKDLLIFLGDFVDDTVDNDYVKSLLRYCGENFPKNRIFVRGNNDMLSDSALKKLGWEPCYSAFIKCGILSLPYFCVLSHCPLELNGYHNVFNIHGHIHKQNWDEKNRHYTLWEPTTPDRCINVGNECFDGALLDIEYVISKYKKKVEKFIKNDRKWNFSPKPMKPGMSRYLANQALDEFEEEYYKACGYDVGE